MDCLKGMIPMIIARRFAGLPPQPAGMLTLWLMVGCAAILGHIFSVYLRFKGGKGAATSLGVVLGLYPYFTIPGIVTFVIWVAVLYASKYVSLASIVAALCFPVALTIAIVARPDWRFLNLWPLLTASFLMGILIVARHAENIKRLLEGSEAKAFQKGSV
jgi:glycerol-3-phosphate acyltransferase PlsY